LNRQSSCASTGNDFNAPLNGNFEAPLLFDDRNDYLALSLRETGGSVTGTGFLSPGGYNVSVTGSHSGSDIELQIVPMGGPAMRFVGQAVDDRMSGSWSYVNYGSETTFSIEFVRVDTVATGLSTAVVVSSIPRTESGIAYFFYQLPPTGSQGILWIESTGGGPRMRPAFVWDGLDYLPEGVYPVDATSTRVIGVLYDLGVVGGIRQLTVLGGELRVDIARRHVLIGRYTIRGRAENGDTVNVTGSFSA
jgi:hypothetical protein